MNRAQRRKNKNAQPIKIEIAQHKKLKKLAPFLLGSLMLCVVLFIGLFCFYSQFYHNELGKVKLECADSSIIYVEEDGTFKWYRAKWEKDATIEKDKEYLAGVLRFYTGDSAYKILDKNSQHFFGITSDTIESMYDEEHQKEDLFIMIVKGTYFKEVAEGKVAKDNTDYVKYYIGFKYNDGEILETMEQQTGGIQQFEVKDYNE